MTRRPTSMMLTCAAAAGGATAVTTTQPRRVKMAQTRHDDDECLGAAGPSAELLSGLRFDFRSRSEEKGIKTDVIAEWRLTDAALAASACQHAPETATC